MAEFKGESEDKQK
jgi:hypothetical protein